MNAFRFDTIDSTNEAAKRMIDARQIHEPCYLTAREQTAGKGSHGRIWLSPRDAGLYLSVVDLPPDPDVKVTSAYTLAAGIACVEAIGEATGLDVMLKPINDLYVGRAKLGGILVEAVIQSGRVTALITGIGINVFYADRPLGKDAVRPICLQQLMPAPHVAQLDLAALEELLAERVLSWNVRVHQGHADDVRRVWQRHATGPDACADSPVSSRSASAEPHRPGGPPEPTPCRTAEPPSSTAAGSAGSASTTAGRR
jgi:biotin-[acetyl-CoA-carboxylase] ligase BirA-like protein